MTEHSNTLLLLAKIGCRRFYDLVTPLAGFAVDKTGFKAPDAKLVDHCDLYIVRVNVSQQPEKKPIGKYKPPLNF
jgi:hypothetical protein